MVGQVKGVAEYRIVLFALTGIGNSVLQSLVLMGCKPVLIVTRREKGPFPHYPLPDIATIAAEMGIPVSYGEEGEKKAQELQADIIIIGTYHRVLSAQLVTSAKYAFNLHPSLLPRYRGPCPFFWVLMNGECETGMTVHYITDQFDEGAIVLQRRIPIQRDETQGSLREKLALLSAEVVTELLGHLVKGKLQAVKQDEALATSYPKIPDGWQHVDITTDIEKAVRQIRALTPWPGAMLENGRKIKNIHEMYSCPPELTSEIDEHIVIKIGDVPFLIELDCVGGELKE